MYHSLMAPLLLRLGSSKNNLRRNFKIGTVHLRSFHTSPCKRMPITFDRTPSARSRLKTMINRTAIFHLRLVSCSMEMKTKKRTSCARTRKLRRLLPSVSSLPLPRYSIFISRLSISRVHIFSQVLANVTYSCDRLMSGQVDAGLFGNS
jgi:hypothetical protein